MQFVRAAVSFLLAACSAVAFAQARELPDFTRLVEDQGAAVVNIRWCVLRSGVHPVMSHSDQPITAMPNIISARGSIRSAARLCPRTR